MSQTSARAETAELLAERSYMLFIAARLAATIGVQVQGTAILWQVYTLAKVTLTHGGQVDPVLLVKQSAFIISLIGLIQFLPVLFLTLIAGQVADRYDRKLILRITLCVDIVATLSLALLAAFKPTLWPIFVIAGVFGASRAFMGPAGGSMVPMLIPRHLMPRALAWSSLSFYGATTVGAAMGGILVAAISPVGAYGLAAVLYLVAITLLSGIKKNTRPEHNPASRLEMVKEGLVYVWREKIVFGAISLDLFAVLLGGATLLMPVFAVDVLHVGSAGFGLLRSSQSAGGLLVAAWLAAHPIKRHAGAVMFTGVAIFSLATIVFGVAQPMTSAIGIGFIAYPLSIAALATLGGADMLSVYVRQTLVQIVTPDAMRGRVAAVSGLFIGASNELGEFESGLVARFLGPIGAAVFGGVGALAVTGLWSQMFPALRKADRLTGD